MYSYEIDNILRQHNYNLPAHIYLDIFNIDKTPQIAEIKYNAWEDNFYVRTHDNYNWNFKVYKEN